MLQMPVSSNGVQEEYQTECDHPFLVVVEGTVLGRLGKLQHFNSEVTVRDTHDQEDHDLESKEGEDQREMDCHENYFYLLFG